MSVEEDIHMALDLDWSDGYGAPGENVRADTIGAHGKDLLTAVGMMHAEEAMTYSISTILGERHPVAEIYAIDFPSDLRASLYAMLGGYYRQAIFCLRSWLEIRLLGIYFGKVDQSQYADWKAGNVGADDPLFGKRMITRLFGRAELSKADGRNGLRARLEGLYGELSAFSHGQGLEKHDLHAGQDNVPRHLPDSVKIHLELLCRAFNKVAYCTWLIYGVDSLKQMSGNEATMTLAVLRPEYLAEMAADLKSRVNP